MNPAIVFNVFFNGLGVIRALGENGIKVMALDSNKKAVGRYSKYTTEFKVVTDPSLNDAKFIDELIEFGKRSKWKPVLFPTNDTWSIAISKHKQRLEKYFLTYNSDYSVIKKIVDKSAFYKMMEEENILIPKTYHIRNYNELKKYKDQLIYPLILKPNARMEVNRNPHQVRVYNLNRMVVINKYDDFFKHKLLIEKYDFLIQQKIEGLSNKMFTIGIYADKDSNVRAVFSGRKVRGFPVDHGDCFAGETYWVDELVEQSKKIVKILGYTGIAEIEYKYNVNDGRYYLIEMNPRTWSWIGITPKAGVNLPLIAYKDLIGEDIPKYMEMDKNKRVIWTRSIEDRYNCKKNHTDINDKDFLKSEDEWIESLKKYDVVVYADCDLNDMMPGLIWKKYWKKYALMRNIKIKFNNIASYFKRPKILGT